MISSKSLVSLLVPAILSTAIGCSGQTSSPAAKSDNVAKSPTSSLVWRHGILKSKSDAGFEYMAAEKQFFKKYGVDVKFLEFNDDQSTIKALIAGELDSIEGDPASVIKAVEKGEHLKIIGSTLSGMTFSLYTSGSIKNFKDLEGKKIGVSAPGSLPELLVKAMLMNDGVKSESLTIVNAGNDAQRYQALKSGKIDAVANSVEFVPQAKADGINVLSYAHDSAPNYPRYMIISSEKSLKAHPDAATAFLAGEIEGMDYAQKHKDEELQLAAKKTNEDPNSPRLTSMFDEILKEKAIAPNLEIPKDKINWEQDFLVKLGILPKKVDVDSLVDDSFRQKALQEIEKKNTQK